jgi:hypothetical protein
MQPLAPVFQHGDPDIGQDGMEYSKGQLMLETLEAAFGRNSFDEYLAGYFKHFEFQAINSEQFLEYIDANLLRKFPGHYSRAQVEKWLYHPGIPDDAAVPVSSSLEAAAAMAAAWSQGEQSAYDLPAGEWSPQAMVAFINALPAELQEVQLRELDESLGLSTTRNAEIARAWFIQAARRNFRAAYGEMRSYLNRYGRTRLVKPVYQALVANGQDGELAQEFFEEARVNYHPLTVAAISPLLSGAPEE